MTTQLTIKYGLLANNMDVTDNVYKKCNSNGIIYFPPNDNIRSYWFGDPLPGIVKSIYIVNKRGIASIYYDTDSIYIDTNTNPQTVYTQRNAPEIIQQMYPDINRYTKILFDIHPQLKFDYGRLDFEFSVERIIVKYLTGTEKVLEIGGGIGRNSVIIAYLLRLCQNPNFVSVESNPDNIEKLVHNRDINGFTFAVECVDFLNKSVSSDNNNMGISYRTFCEKYNIEFDTLVLDCGGEKIHNIIVNDTDLLQNISLIVMVNGFNDITTKLEVDQILKEKGFNVDYVEPGGYYPCFENFFEVWKK